MIYLHFVRHGETIFNTYHRMQGWCDTPLTDKGRKQAIDVAKGLGNIPYYRVYASDSGRAMETAQYIAEAKGLKVFAKKGFREMFFGTMEGLDTMIGRGQNKEYRDQNGWIDVGGEDMQMLENRVFDAIAEILPPQKEKDEHIIIVSHGIAIMSIIHRLDKDFFSQLDDYGGVLFNTSITTITYDQGNFAIQDFNNIAYRETGGKRKNEKNY